ncbi:MAG: tRNA (adenosine(37)-N6)-threonylcarbamoyltransferase complex transferase subunit TsaD [Selenomonadales bacterium]|nr:tRNA (adenosine(37)-N6)-threonylcarbamoyltransferase complex transferase subunit TsaD [Selenomonadales bacterium]
MSKVQEQTKKNGKLILAIETSCDETSVALVEDGRKIRANIISSQVPLHRKYGGVVPEIASRKHIENVLPVLEECLTEANVKLTDIDGIGVTYGPGLVGALLVGVSAAKALAFSLGVPLLGVHHLEGHIFANFLENEQLEPPFVALVVSGGHTALVHVKDYSTFELLGQTRDDAVGEAFDKVARVLGLPYPGGPEVERLAREGDPDAIAFPKALCEKGSFEFSFSGLKSAVLNYLNSKKQKNEEINPADVAASFQSAALDVLVEKTMQAMKVCDVKQLVLAGGVAANTMLREKLTQAASENGVSFSYPNKILCTDNAAMIACRAHYLYEEGRFADLHLNGVPSLPLGKA